MASPAASAVEALNPAKEESERSAPAPAARRRAWRRETPSEDLLISGGRLILFILAKSTSDCRIRKYYRSLALRLFVWISRAVEGSVAGADFLFEQKSTKATKDVGFDWVCSRQGNPNHDAAPNPLGMLSALP